MLYISDGNNVPLSTPRQSLLIDDVGVGSISNISHVGTTITFNLAFDRAVTPTKYIMGMFHLTKRALSVSGMKCVSFVEKEAKLLNEGEPTYTKIHLCNLFEFIHHCE